MYVQRGNGGRSVLRSTQITFRSRSCLTNLSVQYCCYFVNIPWSHTTIKRQSAVHRHHASQHTCCLVLMTAGILYQHICCWPCCRINTSAVQLLFNTTAIPFVVRLVPQDAPHCTSSTVVHTAVWFSAQIDYIFPANLQSTSPVHWSSPAIVYSRNAWCPCNLHWGINISTFDYQTVTINVHVYVPLAV